MYIYLIYSSCGQITQFALIYRSLLLIQMETHLWRVVVTHDKWCHSRVSLSSVHWFSTKPNTLETQHHLYHQQDDLWEFRQTRLHSMPSMILSITITTCLGSLGWDYRPRPHSPVPIVSIYWWLCWANVTLISIHLVPALVAYCVNLAKLDRSIRRLNKIFKFSIFGAIAPSLRQTLDNKQTSVRASDMKRGARCGSSRTNRCVK